MGPDISKGLNTRVLEQVCHRDGVNQVRLTKKIFSNLCRFTQSNRSFSTQQRIKFILMNYVWNQTMEK